MCLSNNIIENWEISLNKAMIRLLPIKDTNMYTIKLVVFSFLKEISESLIKKSKMKITVLLTLLIAALVASQDG